MPFVMRVREPKCSTELNTLLHTLGYEQHIASYARVGLCNMAKLTAISKAELKQFGALPGHATLLL